MCLFDELDVETQTKWDIMLFQERFHEAGTPCCQQNRMAVISNSFVIRIPFCFRKQDSSIGFGSPVRASMRGNKLTDSAITSSLLEMVQDILQNTVVLLSCATYNSRTAWSLCMRFLYMLSQSLVILQTY